MNIANDIYAFGTDWQKLVNQLTAQLEQKDIRINQLVEELKNTKLKSQQEGIKKDDT